MPALQLVTRPNGRVELRNTQSVEERCLNSALLLIEARFTLRGPIGPKTSTKALELIKTSMDKTLKITSVREQLAKNVDIWLRLQRVLHAALPIISRRSLAEVFAETAGPGAHIPESSALIVDNYLTLHDDLGLVYNLLVIARNMLAMKEVAQDICSATQLDKVVIRLVGVCINVTSKGYDGENMDQQTRNKLNEITELFKKVLVTSLQFFHNLTMGNERLKMAFWVDMMFDNELQNEPIHELPPDDLRVDLMFDETRNWLKRNNKRSPLAEILIERHKEAVEYGHTAGPLPVDEYASSDPRDTGELTTEVISGQTSGFTSPAQMQILPVWVMGIPKADQDRQYSRGSHELDVWWKKVRDKNYENWVVPMETVESAIARIQAAKMHAMDRAFPGIEHDGNLDWNNRDDVRGELEVIEQDNDNRSLDVQDGDEEGDEEEDEEDEDDDDEYAEGTIRGLLTEITNILDTKQIEALHMTVKGCIVDSMGSGLTKSGENLQKTRCKMFLALDCGKHLLREMLVFVAVWEQSDKEFIFQITAQIIESFHHNALLPYAWDSLRIPKDIVSPAQTVMLRLINYMFRARRGTKIYHDPKDFNRDAKLIHFLYRYFRCRVVIDCVALIHAQAQIRSKKSQEQDFPVDLWDMERAKDGLSQYLDFLSVIAEISEMKPLLVEWELTYELIILLKELESGVERKALVSSPRNHQPGTTKMISTPVSGSGPNSASTDATISDDELPPIKNLSIDANVEHDAVPDLQYTPHKYPWTEIKSQIMTIMASLLAPPAGRSTPGNADVQQQIMKYDGLAALLYCTAYDGHQTFLKERTTIVLKWMMDGCPEAQQFIRDLEPKDVTSAGDNQAAET